MPRPKNEQRLGWRRATRESLRSLLRSRRRSARLRSGRSDGREAHGRASSETGTGVGPDYARAGTMTFVPGTMTYVELLTLLIALLGVVVGFVSLRRTTRLQERTTELQERMTKAEEAQARLAERQLSLIEEEAQRTRTADVQARIEQKNNGHRFVIENYGPAIATGVQVAVEPVNGSHSPFPPSQMQNLSIERLTAGDSRSLIMALSHQSGTAFHVEITWTNQDGSPGARTRQVSL